MKLLIVLSLLLGARVTLAATSSSPTFSQMHVDTFACPSDKRGWGAAAAYGELFIHINGEITEQADLGLELTSVRVTGAGKCDYVYTRKFAPGESAKVKYSSNQNYFDTQILPCNTDSIFYPDELLKQINDAFESEVAHNFHFVTTLSSSSSDSCFYFFVRDLKPKAEPPKAPECSAK